MDASLFARDLHRPCGGRQRPRPGRDDATSLAAALCLLLLAGCAGEPRAPSRSPDEPERGPSTLLLDSSDPAWSTVAPERFQVEIETDLGPFVLEPERGLAPIGVDRFYNLVRAGFYDDSRFFRVREAYIAQFGIPGDPAVTAVWQSRAFPDDPVVGTNTRGTVAYAMTGPDTRTTQIYINLVDNTHLDEQGFSVLGRVVSGMEDVVDRLYVGYGEAAGGGMRAGNQGRMLAEGNAHLDRDFPRLSRLLRARVLP